MNIIDRIKGLEISRNISDRDMMYSKENEQHYFYVGKSNILTLLNVINIRSSYAGGDAPLRDILDFGCGHGRVTRWIRSAFPEAQVWVTDYDKTGVAWCVENFNCRDTGGKLSHSQFDLIWLGSVFTHLPKQIVEPLVQDLLQALKPNGVLAFSTQGRFAVERMKTFDWGHDTRTWMHYNLDEKSFNVVERTYDQTGYGYVNYPGQENYGVCVAKAEWYSAQVLKSNDFLQILFQEKGTDNHQDVSAFLRASLLDPSKGPLW